jgi:hypothetical protein
MRFTNKEQQKRALWIAIKQVNALPVMNSRKQPFGSPFNGLSTLLPGMEYAFTTGFIRF